MNPKIEAAVDAIKAVYRYQSSGGYLHSAIDDGNLECLDDEIPAICPWTGKRFSPGMRKRYQTCVDALRELSIDGREYACAVVHGCSDAWIDEHERMTGEAFDENTIARW